MKDSLSAQQNDLWKEISRILWEKWDPIGVYSKDAKWTDEYDSYVPSIFALVTGGRDALRISIHLIGLQTQNMGLSVKSPNPHDANIAELILTAHEEIFGQ